MGKKNKKKITSGANSDFMIGVLTMIRGIGSKKFFG
jgi:hypothetical protein